MTFSKLKQNRVQSFSHTPYEILRKDRPPHPIRDIQLDCSCQSSRGPHSEVDSRSAWKEELTAAIHSPIFRTLSPHLSSTHRKHSFTPLIYGSTVSRRDTEGQLSSWGAAFSIINLFLGLGLLSFPYVANTSLFIVSLQTCCKLKNEPFCECFTFHSLCTYTYFASI